MHNITQRDKISGECQIGYTHYFNSNRAFTELEWTAILTFARNLFKDQKHVLANGSGESGTKPTATSKEIRFNGIGDASFETCYISKKVMKGCNFTKTAQKEYDSSVVAILTYIGHIAPGALSISSDGSTMRAFAEGMALAKKISGVMTLLPPVTVIIV